MRLRKSLGSWIGDQQNRVGYVWFIYLLFICFLALNPRALARWVTAFYEAGDEYSGHKPWPHGDDGPSRDHLGSKNRDRDGRLLRSSSKMACATNMHAAEFAIVNSQTPTLHMEARLYPLRRRPDLSDDGFPQRRLRFPSLVWQGGSTPVLIRWLAAYPNHVFPILELCPFATYGQQRALCRSSSVCCYSCFLGKLREPHPSFLCRQPELSSGPRTGEDCQHAARCDVTLYFSSHSIAETDIGFIRLMPIPVDLGNSCHRPHSRGEVRTVDRK